MLTDGDEQAQGVAGRKGKSNAILTYETVAKLDGKLSATMMRIESLIATVTENEVDRKSDHTDHEVRLRVVEKAQIAFEAAHRQSTGQWQWVWSAATVILTLIIQLTTLYIFSSRAIPVH